MAITYKAIATTTVGAGGAANIDFTSIPQTFTDLLLTVSARSTGAAANWILIGINGGSDTAIDLRHMYDNNGSAIAQAYASFRTPIAESGYASGMFSNSQIYIPSYTASQIKGMYGDGMEQDNDSDTGLQLVAYRWNNTAAITRLTLTVDGGSNFAQYSTASLYGISNS